ncbi:MAG: PAS domain S-box protein, partial [Gammaproteobacteria bacterium]|nr:PAS domain S-box protein [Gammaproteobacteria bacterium]
MDDDTLKKSQEENSFHNLIALYESESNSTVNDAFDCISVSLCICDISEIYLELQKYKLANVTDIKTHLIANPHLVKLLIAAIRLINVNRATMTMFKFDTLSESQEHNLHHLLSESIKPLLDAAEAIWRGQDYFSSRILLRDSEQKPFTALLSFYPPKSLIESKCLCVTILDITKDIEQEQRLKAVTNALPDLTFITTEDGTTLEVMSSQEHLLYKPKETVVGKKLQDIIPGDVGESILSTIKKTIETNQKQLLEYPLKINDDLCWFEGSCSPIQGDFKGQRAAVWLAREITDKKNFEVHLRHVQKMQAIGSLSGGIAHEFNNLLSPILGYSDLMLQNKSMSEFEQHAIELIYNASKRASELVKQLMAYGGRSMSQRTEINLSKLTNELLPLIKGSLGGRITLSLDINPDTPTVFGVANDLKQAIINICENAKNAMPDGGSLHICQTIEERNDLANEQHYVALHISDSGSGIPLKILDRIFEPFFTTRGIGEGTGLG